MEQQIRQINLEDEKPTVSQAMARLQLELRLAKRQDICVLKIIHGFGSTGNGGKIQPCRNGDRSGFSFREKS